MEAKKVSREGSSKYKFRQREEWKSIGKLAEGGETQSWFRSIDFEVNYISVQYMNLGLERQ